jgi:hypothetical protein
MLQKWREHGAITYAGYILGFPGDTKESILRDIAIVQKELPLDVLEFFYLTPLPGSEDHKTMLGKGVWMDPDLNKYDLNHRVTHHPRMSDAEWDEAYRAAWAAYYTPEHIRTILRRTAAHRLGRVKTTLMTVLWFTLMIRFEGVHPLEGGGFRLKYRRDRRGSMRRENALVFYPRYGVEIVRKVFGYTRTYLQAMKILREVLKAPDRWTYTDLALQTPDHDEFDNLELFQATQGGKAELARRDRHEAIKARQAAAEPVAGND